MPLSKVAKASYFPISAYIVSIGYLNEIILFNFHSMQTIVTLVSRASWPIIILTTIDFPSSPQASSLFMVSEVSCKRTCTRKCSRISFFVLLSGHFSHFPQMENLLAGYFPSLIKNNEIFFSSSHELLYGFANRLSADFTPPPGLEGRNSLIWRRKGDDEYRWPEPGSVSCYPTTNVTSFQSKWSNLQSGLYLLD